MKSKTRGTALLLAGMMAIAGFGIGPNSQITKPNTTNYPSVESDGQPAKMQDGVGPNLDDPAVVATVAQNIFVGHIVSSLGSTDERGFTESVYVVALEQNLKNELMGSVKVAKMDDTDGGLFGDKYFKRGERYLMATRYSETKNWHSLATSEKIVESSNSPSFSGDGSVIEKYRKGLATPAPALNQELSPDPIPPATAGQVG